MEEAQELSDQIAIMDQGKVIAQGTHAELVQIVGELHRVDLQLSAPPERVVPAWQGTEGVRRVTVAAGGEGQPQDGTVTVLVDDSNLVLPRLFESATAAGVRITSVQIQEPNLETVFLHVTGRALRD
jgi:ABC-2 type transport system ATP-binding protein